jgi:hypothetical protein
VWWKADLRARREATQKAAAPVTLAQAVAVVGALVLAAGLFSTVAGGWSAWSAWIGGVADALGPWGAAPDVAIADAPILRYGLPLGLAAWIVLAPVALYLALRRD